MQYCQTLLFRRVAPVGNHIPLWVNEIVLLGWITLLEIDKYKPNYAPFLSWNNPQDWYTGSRARMEKRAILMTARQSILLLVLVTFQINSSCNFEKQTFHKRNTRSVYPVGATLGLAASPQKLASWKCHFFKLGWFLIDWFIFSFGYFFVLLLTFLWYVLD